jgi:hypothetical protein
MLDPDQLIALKKAKKFCERVGVPIRFATSEKKNTNCSYTWDGKLIRPWFDTIEMQLHDVAHWLVCPKRRLKKPEFGLGPDPARIYPLDNELYKTVSDQTGSNEETLTCEVQFALVYFLGLDISYAQEGVNTENIPRKHLKKVLKHLPLTTKEKKRLRRALGEAGALG